MGQTPLSVLSYKRVTSEQKHFSLGRLSCRSLIQHIYNTHFLINPCGHHCQQPYGCTIPPAGKNQAVYQLRTDHHSSTEPGGFGSGSLYFSLLIVYPFGSCGSIFKWENKNAFYLGLESMKRYNTFNGKELVYCKHCAGECDCTASASEYL